PEVVAPTAADGRLLLRCLTSARARRRRVPPGGVTRCARPWHPTPVRALFHPEVVAPTAADGRLLLRCLASARARRRRVPPGGLFLQHELVELLAGGVDRVRHELVALDGDVEE